MVGPSSQISKFLLGLLLSVLIFYIFMDASLYVRIQNYPIERTFRGVGYANSAPAPSERPAASVGNATSGDPPKTYEETSWLGCRVSPLCDVTVKALLLDHTNHYLFSPLATVLDGVLGVSDAQWITPNMISFFHVLVAVLSGKCVSSDSLVTRRVGVVLFQIRTFLDDMDGHVARTRKHVKGERSEIGTSGYYVDGLCDALGCIALTVGMFVFLKNNPPRRGYIQLQAILPTDAKNAKADGVIYKAKITTKKVARKVGCYAAQMLLSSTAWNRYIALYQDMLERDDVTRQQFVRQNVAFKSSIFFCVVWLWRIVNVHNMIHVLLLAIFCDKLWEFLRAVQYVGFVVLLCVICVSEMHVLEVQNYIFKNLTGNSTSF